MGLIGDVRGPKWVRGLLDFAFPPLCLGCGVYCESSQGICDSCLGRIQQFDRPLCLDCLAVLPDDAGRCAACGLSATPLYACGDYTPPLRDIVIEFKFKGITTPAGTFADMINRQFGPKIAAHGPARLVPIPLHPYRENLRGFNQAALLAGALSGVLQMPVADDIISRVRRRRPQSKLGIARRRDNIKGVFEVPRKAEGAERLILVDDVVTSGSTLREARSELTKAGYEVVAAISIAHGI
jgi:ComF family protein